MIDDNDRYGMRESMENVKINKSRYRLSLYLAFCLALLLAIPIQTGGYSKDTGLKIIFSVVIFVIASKVVRELLTMKPVITLDEHGIDVRDKGYYIWDMFEAFSIVLHYDSHDQELKFHFPGGHLLIILINDLEKDPDEITELVLKASGRDGSFFLGKERRS